LHLLSILIFFLKPLSDKPHWSFNETLPVQYAYVGGAVNLSCDSMGEPPPSFTWLHNGKGIVGFNHRIFVADYGATLQLQMKNVSQFGDYKCKVANPLGMLERVIKLRPGPKPLGPTRFQLKRLYTNGLLRRVPFLLKKGLLVPFNLNIIFNGKFRILFFT